MWCHRMSFSLAQMPVHTEVGSPCCASIHQQQVLPAVGASLMPTAAASRTSGCWLCVILCRRCAACFAKGHKEGPYQDRPLLCPFRL